MNSETAAALNRINRRFYSRHASNFAATRTRPWPGWDRAMTVYSERRQAADRSCGVPSILDVGCGNGRFAEYLTSLGPDRLAYLGVDESREMLKLARRKLSTLASVEWRLERSDFVGNGLRDLLEGERFDLVVVFGVLHHIPGLEHRRALLQTLEETLAAGGVLMVSFWQFGEQERFRQRFLDWSEHNRESLESIDLDQLESGDHLLTWGSAGESGLQAESGTVGYRYCHHTTEEEAESLLGTLELTPLDRFRCDGRSGDLNLYHVLGKGNGYASRQESVP